MSAKLIDGKAIAAEVEAELRSDIAQLAARGIRPGLAAVRVGDDPASEVYVRNKARKAEELGLKGTQLHFDASISEDDLLAEIDSLNHDEEIDGILLQLPLPRHINARRGIATIDPAKDVDGFHPMSVGKLQIGMPTLVACTPAGVIRMIESTGETIRGKRAVVIGRSDIVGKPMAALLMHRDATVTICHSKTRDLPAVVAEAGIVIAAIGKPLFVTGEMIKPGALVIDVGINRVEPGDAVAARLDAAKRKTLEQKGSVLVGDVDFPAAFEKAGWITPVPGGVGPMTIIMLMKNTVQAAKERRG
ncbi:MAG: bifunctional 5,10-methylenetetrahydrofolate dehydrogenase/5,10-methenyltetrahydrofolate cyclohydrolase [Thermoanaerobaculia bacterium]